MRDLRTHLWISLFILAVFLVVLGIVVYLIPGLSGPPMMYSAAGRASPRGFNFSHRRPPGRPPVGDKSRAPGRILRRLGTVLELSEEQSERLEALFQTQREQLDTRREAFRASVAEILTPTQMELFEKKFRGKRGRTRVNRKLRPIEPRASPR